MGQGKRSTGLRDRIRKWCWGPNRLEELCLDLRQLGIDAQMAKRGRAEEKTEWKGGLVKWIDIPEGPIRWVIWESGGGGGMGGGVSRWAVYGVPDPRVDESLRRVIPTPAGWGQSHWAALEIKTPEIESPRIQYSPLLGKVVDSGWHGEDLGLGIMDRLNGDISTRQPIAKGHRVKIRAHLDHRCWTISDLTGRPPSGELWRCYQTIARHLLAEWSPSSREDEPKGGSSQ